MNFIAKFKSLYKKKSIFFLIILKFLLISFQRLFGLKMCIIILCMRFCYVLSNHACTPCDLMEVPMIKIFEYARICSTCGDFYGDDIENCCFCHKRIRNLCRSACGG